MKDTALTLDSTQHQILYGLMIQTEIAEAQRKIDTYSRLNCDDLAEHYQSYLMRLSGKMARLPQDVRREIGEG